MYAHHFLFISNVFSCLNIEGDSEQLLVSSHPTEKSPSTVPEDQRIKELKTKNMVYRITSLYSTDIHIKCESLRRPPVSEKHTRSVNGQISTSTYVWG